MTYKTATFAEKAKPMLLKDFFTRFPDEDSCETYFKRLREEVGIVCPQCGSTKYRWLKGRHCFQCATCGCRIPLTKGTVMEHSKLPLYDWFFTAHLMTSIKQVLSAKEIQHQLELEYYTPAWLMMMKLRDIMGKRDSEYKLSGKIEMDVSFFPTTIMTQQKDNNIDDVPQTKKTQVLVLAGTKDIDDILAEYLSHIADNKLVNKASALLKKVDKLKVKKSIQYIKMFAMPNQKFETIKPYASAAIEKESTIISDGGHNLIGMKDIFKKHDVHVETEGGTHEVVTKVLPWVHIVTGECRSGIDAIHKEIDERFLQLYLNEYCWKFNRRFFRDSKDPKYDLFDHLMRIAAKYTSDIKWNDYPFKGN